MGKTQRVLDPVHGLIAFRGSSPIDQLAWQLINTREFQRLRRIRQLGFSELVFPGATHTRFSHCIGVYHTARQLLEVIGRKVGNDERRVVVALCAALLHDLGHGPFSHTFEGVEKKRRAKKRHEEWTAEMIRGDTEIHAVLDKRDPTLAEEVATLLTQREPKDIYSSVVSSQFDADRLDYLRRDRYMTGAGSGGFDYQWLLDCLEVGKFTIRLSEEESDYEEVVGLYLNHKGLHAAEGYLLARYHLYSQIYLHKTTRGAEAMLSALLVRVAEFIQHDRVKEAGLSESHPLVLYFRSDQRDLSAYSRLDDSVIWASLSEMSAAPDKEISSLAKRLCDRALFKCFDAGHRAKETRGDSLQRFRKKLRERCTELGFTKGLTLLEDEAKITAYGVRSFDEPGALQNVLIGDGDHPEDIQQRSPIVGAIREDRLVRIYVPDTEGEQLLQKLWEETTR